MLQDAFRFMLQLGSLTRALCTLICIVVGSSAASGDQVVESKDDDALKQSILPAAFNKKVVAHLKDASLAESLDKLMPASDPLSYVVEDLPQRSNSDLNFEGTLKGALDRVADLFDMTWRVRKSNLVIFEMRFNNPDEHPQLILPELVRIAHDMNVTLKGIPYQSGIWAGSGAKQSMVQLRLNAQRLGYQSRCPEFSRTSARRCLRNC